MKKVKLGIVGMGRMGSCHAEDIAFRMKNAELTAVCCRTMEKALDAKEALGAKYAFSDYEQMLQCQELDGVVICSASALHCRQVIAAVQAKKHVFCEKPLGVTLEQCLEVEKAVNANKDVMVQIGFMTRYDAAYKKAYQMIRDGRIGNIVYVRAYRMDQVKHIQSSIDFAERSGGIFLDVAVHDIDLARWLIQEDPVSVYALGSCYRYKEFAKYGDYDNATVTLEFENGAMCTILSGRTCPHGFHVETEIIGTHGTIHVGARNGQSELYLYDENGVNQSFEGWFMDRFKEAFLEEKEDFADCILHGRASGASVRDAVIATKVAADALQSCHIKEKQKVYLDSN